MAAVSETIVREYFELQGFFVRQQRKSITPGRREDEEVDFFAINPHFQPRATPLPFLLTAQDLVGIQRAIIVVKAWHTDKFSPSLLANAPEIFRFLEPSVFQQAAKAFGAEGEAVAKLLVLPGLPDAVEARTQSIEMLRAKGITAVIPFHTILADLIESTEANRNYQKSDLLQMLRILKNYDFFREAQMELFKARPRRAAKARRAPAEPAGPSLV